MSCRDSVAQIHLLSRTPDSLISRKNGLRVAGEVQRRAGLVDPDDQKSVSEFDLYLRSEDHQLNPGTTADLIAASVYLLLRTHPFGEKIMSDATYRVDVSKEQFVFSAAHFITFAGDICERIHGHNYGVRASIEGPLDENRYVVDFIALRDAVLEQTQALDHP